jgi:ankyrin repeat protein
MADAKLEFVRACVAGDLNMIKQLVDGGLSPNFHDKPVPVYLAKTPLSILLHDGNSEAALWLIEHPSTDLLFTDGNKRGPLHQACTAGLDSVVRKLLELKPALVNEVDWNGDTPLHVACGKGNLGVVKALLEHGASVNSLNERGEAPAYSAALKGHADTFFELVRAGCELHDEGLLAVACIGANARIVRHLLENGHADMVNVKDHDSSGWTPLHVACSQLSLECAELLLDFGADIDTEDEDGQTPIATLIGSIPERDGGADDPDDDDDDEDFDDGEFRAELRESPQFLAGRKLIISLIERGCSLSFSGEIDGRDPDGALTTAIRYFVSRLSLIMNVPIPPHRRAIRWALSVGAIWYMRDLVRELHGHRIGYYYWYVKTPEEAAELKEKRLKSLKDDAWKRRRHLCIDRALWRKPTASEPKKLSKDGEDAAIPANAGAGKAE